MLMHKVRRAVQVEIADDKCPAQCTTKPVGIEGIDRGE